MYAVASSLCIYTCSSKHDTVENHLSEHAEIKGCSGVQVTG